MNIENISIHDVKNKGLFNCLRNLFFILFSMIYRQLTNFFMIGTILLFNMVPQENMLKTFDPG